MVSVNKGEWDKSLDIKEKLKFHRNWLKAVRNVLKDNGTIFITSTFHSVYSIGVALEMEGFSIINNIIWRKTNPPPNLSGRAFTHSTETIIWARKQLTPRKKGNHFFAYEEMKKYNKGKQLKDFWDIEEDTQVLSFGSAQKNEKNFGRHPTQKPLKLISRLIESASKPGDVVLDPFLGSGTTLVATVNLKRYGLGIENDINSIELAKRRLMGETDG
jgi:site-specific DNA-methyltransferase (adenine-specific)